MASRISKKDTVDTMLLTFLSAISSVVVVVFKRFYSDSYKKLSNKEHTYDSNLFKLMYYNEVFDELDKFIDDNNNSKKDKQIVLVTAAYTFHESLSVTLKDYDSAAACDNTDLNTLMDCVNLINNLFMLLLSNTEIMYDKHLLDKLVVQFDEFTIFKKAIVKFVAIKTLLMGLLN